MPGDDARLAETRFDGWLSHAGVLGRAPASLCTEVRGRRILRSSLAGSWIKPRNTIAPMALGWP